MNIKLDNIGKRYNYEWIFRNVTLDLHNAHNYVILGANGSGKSTLLQVIASNLIQSEGAITHALNGNTIELDNVYKYISYAAPYLDLFDEFTLIESLEFHSKFKAFQNGLTIGEIVKLTELEKAKNKQLKYYSSGMRQRVRLALAVLSDTPLLLLDEPTSNLDRKAIDWYQKLVTDFSKDRLIIVASNQQEYEYPFCDQQISVEDYKK